jgi:hypothetical protein
LAKLPVVRRIEARKYLPPRFIVKVKAELCAAPQRQGANAMGKNSTGAVKTAANHFE